jgi:hypothetical protein
VDCATRHLGNDLIDRLLSDSDPFVRACVYESSSTVSRSVDPWQDMKTGALHHGSDLEPLFLAATQLERLALMRNPRLGDLFSQKLEIIEKLFDREDETLGLVLVERTELVRTYIWNPKTREASRERSGTRHGWTSTDLHPATKSIGPLFGSLPPNGPREPEFRKPSIENWTRLMMPRRTSIATARTLN